MKIRLKLCLASSLLVCSVAVLAEDGSLNRQRDLAQIRTQLAVEYAKVGNLKVALETAAQAIDADARYAPAHTAQAYVFGLLSQDTRAEAAYRRALQLAPDNPEANNNYGIFLCERKHVEQSLPFFEKALANPLYDSPQTAYLNLGRCHAKVGNMAQANDYLLMALRVAPNFVPALRELASLHLSEDNPKLAAFYFDRMVPKGLTASLPPGDLWLGVQVARHIGDKTGETNYSHVLKSRYPDSKETQLLLSGS